MKLEIHKEQSEKSGCFFALNKNKYVMFIIICYEKTALNMIKKGKSIEEIIEITELSYEKIIELNNKTMNKR